MDVLSEKSEVKLEKYHKHISRVDFSEYEKSSDEISARQRYLRFSIIDAFKSTSKLNPQFMWSFFSMQSKLRTHDKTFKGATRI